MVRPHIGLVSHQSLVYGDLSAENNLTFFAKLYNLDNIPERVTIALDRVGLKLRRRGPVRTFSRGMLQRLTIARATLHQPDILLLDEPYTGLDQDASVLLDQLLQREHDEGRTILMITHDLLRGFRLCDRALILVKGKISREVARSELDGEQFLNLYRDLLQGKMAGYER
jgi:heme exporter protein A